MNRKVWLSTWLFFSLVTGLNGCSSKPSVQVISAMRARSYIMLGRGAMNATSPNDAVLVIKIRNYKGQRYLEQVDKEQRLYLMAQGRRYPIQHLLDLQNKGTPEFALAAVVPANVPQFELFVGEEPPQMVEAGNEIHRELNVVMVLNAEENRLDIQP